MSSSSNYNADERDPSALSAGKHHLTRPPADNIQAQTHRLNNEEHTPGLLDHIPAESLAATDAEADQETGRASVFKNRNFMLLWTAQALTQTAQNTLNLALVNYVYQLSGGSPTQTAIATVAFVLPGVFFSALAGAFVDRVNKRTILIVTNILRAAIIPWLVFMANIPIAIALPLIFLITCLFSTFSQFFAPAEGALIPFLVPEKQLTQANSLFQITLFASQFVGFSLLAPLLPRWIGSQNLFWVVSAIFAICIFLTWWLPDNLENKSLLGQANTGNLVSTLWVEIKEGWRFIRSVRPIWMSIIYLSTVQSVLFSLTAIGIPYVSKPGMGLGQPEGDIIYILAPLSVGLGFGVWLVNRLITPRNRGRIMILAIVAMGLNLIGIGLLKPLAELWVSIFTPGVPIGGPGLILAMIALSIPFGFEIALLNIPALTVLQEKSPKDIVGRVFAAYFTFANLVSIFPILFAGAMSDLIGLVPTFFLIGLAVLGVGYYGYRDRYIRKTVQV